MTGKALHIIEGGRLEIPFILDDPGKSTVSKEAVVRKKYDNQKGVNPLYGQT